MLRPRRLVLLCLGVLAFAAPAHAATPPPPVRPVLPDEYTLSTAHFVVHYTSDVGPNTSTEAITETQAGDIAAYAERAYAAETSWGYPAPLDDGDGKTDIYVVDLSAGGWSYAAIADGGGLTSTGSIDLDPNVGLNQHALAGALFQVIAMGIWNSADTWLSQAASEWAAFKVDGYPIPTPDQLGPWDESLTCDQPVDTIHCDRTWYNGSGLSRWPVFEYLTERFGVTFPLQVLQQGALLGVFGNAGTALANALAAKGANLASVYDDAATVNMTAGYSIPSLQGIAPQPFTTITTGDGTTVTSLVPTSTPVVLQPVTVDVNHLATRYVAFQRGNGSSAAPCHPATLAISVTLPSGSGSVPAFWWGQRDDLGVALSQSQSLSVSGRTATITVPWDTCNWGGTMGYLSLPNPSTTADAQDFTVGATLTVDPTTFATATPPVAVKIAGQVIPVSTAPPPPDVSVFGPAVIPISAKDATLRLIVSADTDGSIQASLGTYALGTAKLRAGGNDIRFTVPTAALAGARRAAAASDVLTLTPLSTIGTAGTPVQRQVQVLSPLAKPKPKRTSKKKPKRTARHTRR